MTPELRAALTAAIAEHVHVASEAAAALEAVIAVAAEAVEDARDRALADAQEAVERGCSDPSAAICVMELR